MFDDNTILTGYLKSYTRRGHNVLLFRLQRCISAEHGGLHSFIDHDADYPIFSYLRQQMARFVETEAEHQYLRWEDVDHDMKPG